MSHATESGNPGAESETVVMTIRRSQWNNFGMYALCLLLSPLVIPIFIAGYVWLKTRSLLYTLTDQRIKIEEGILAKNRSTMELYRVNDIQSSQRAMQRLVGIGDVALITTDATNPTLVLAGVPDPGAVQDRIRALAEARKLKRGVRLLDPV